MTRRNRVRDLLSRIGERKPVDPIRSIAEGHVPFGSGGSDSFVDEEPYRLLGAFESHLGALLREVAAEIEVAADTLMSRGWPVARFRLITEHGGDVTKTQLMLTRGVEFPRDQVVFEVRRLTVYGPLVETTVRVTSQIAGYWVVSLDNPSMTPSAKTIASA